MADIITLIPSFISVKDVATVLECGVRTASRKVEPIKHTFVIQRTEPIPVKIFCAYFNVPLSTLIRKLYPNLYLELRQSYTTSQLDQMF